MTMSFLRSSRLSAPIRNFNILRAFFLNGWVRSSLIQQPLACEDRQTLTTGVFHSTDFSWNSKTIPTLSPGSITEIFSRTAQHAFNSWLTLLMTIMLDRDTQ